MKTFVALLFAIVIACVACLDTAANDCGGGIVCPLDKQCVAGGGCASPEQIAACAGLAAGTACSFGREVGTCINGVCVGSLCGNGTLDPGEVCDWAGNTNCRKDCLKLAVCGDGVLDAYAGEQCDEGSANSDLPNATCRTNCMVPYCGDGIVDTGEQCEAGELGGRTCLDFGYYQTAGLACSPLCSFDTSACAGSCGDRVVNGGELCDGQIGGQTCLEFGGDEGTVGCLASCGFDLSACRSFLGTPWTPIVSGTTADLFAVWGSSEQDIFAVGGSGTILHFDGTTWTAMSTPTPAANFRTVWGTGPNDVYAGSYDGALLHYGGSVWSVVPNSTIQVWSLWGTGPADIFAATGEFGDGGGMYHYDGVAWSMMPSTPIDPSDGVSTLSCTAVWGSGSADVYAECGTLYHYDGTTWNPSASGDAAEIDAIWGSGSTDVYAVGLDYQFKPIIVHYDGTAWTSTPVAASYVAIWGTGPGDVFATGQDSPNNHFIAHYDGTSWSVMDTSLIAPALFRGGWASGDGVVYAVGSGGTILRHDIGSWSPMHVASDQSVLHIRGADRSDLLAAIANPNAPSGTLWQLQGATWTQTTPQPPFARDVVRFSPDDIVVVGNMDGYHYDGTTWTDTALLPLIPEALWAVAPNNVIAVGNEIHQWNGTTWTQMPHPNYCVPPLYPRLHDVWAAGPNDAFAVGDGGLILHYDGTAWTAMTSGTVANLRGVWGTAHDDIFAVGDGGIVLHFDGGRWSSMSSGTLFDLYAVSGTGPGNVLAVGDNGAITRYDGLSWAPERSGTANLLWSVWTDGGRSFAGGNDGTIRVRGRACTATETRCSVGVDDDCDGHYGCGDSDCATDPSCAAGGLCAGATSIACGAVVAGTTEGGPRHFERYSCDAWNEHGQEAYYRFDAAATGQVTVSLSGLTSDLDLIVLAEGAGGGCEPRNPGCLGGSSTGGNASETVVFNAVAGRHYYFVVDGFAANAGAFSLSVTCP